MIAHSVLPASGAGAVRIFPCPGPLRDERQHDDQRDQHDEQEQDDAPKGGA